MKENYLYKAFGLLSVRLIIDGNDRILPVYVSTARSSLLDRSFDLCEFRDDPEPLQDKIRSRRMKILLRKLWTNFLRFQSTRQTYFTSSSRLRKNVINEEYG